MISTKIEVYNSLIKGKGLVCKEKISKGEQIIFFEGQEITREMADDMFNSGNDYLLQISEDSFLSLPGPERFTNHSCSPNTSFLENGILTALRDILPGEEITFDYSSNENTEFALNCLCGSKQCRKTILPYKELTPQEKSSIQEILSPHIKESIKNKMMV